jgi:hypothetical protein
MMLGTGQELLDIMAARPHWSATHVEMVGSGLSPISWVAQVSAPSHTWTPPVCQAIFRFRFTSRDCSHTSGLLLQHRAAGPDGIRRLTPQHIRGLLMSGGSGRLSQPRFDLVCHHVQERLSNRVRGSTAHFLRQRPPSARRVPLHIDGHAPATPKRSGRSCSPTQLRRYWGDVSRLAV